MTTTVLHLTPNTREAVLDMRAIEKELRKRGKEWAPALSEASRLVVGHARGEYPAPQSILSEPEKESS
jgi:hypothetical protein